MKVLITGNKGFIGRNLCDALTGKPEIEILPFDKDTDISLLEEYTKQCDFVYHLAAVHRPHAISEFDSVNRVFFEEVMMLLRKHKNPCPVLLTSSVHAGPDTDYGKSKLAAEQALKTHSEEMTSRAIIYRLTNTFGRYALPNHHSVVANFCYNIANNLPVTVNDSERVMHLYYIDDVIVSLLTHLDNQTEPDSDGFFRLPADQTYSITLGELSEILFKFNSSIKDQGVYNITNVFKRKLFETFLSYIKLTV